MSFLIRVYNASSIARTPKKKVKRIIEKIFIDENINNCNINVIYVDDEEILKLNRNYLSHNRTTDVITFPMSENKEILEGEIYISAQTAHLQSLDYKVSLRNELLRLAIHGALHLTGYKDKRIEDAKTMKIMEDRYLKQII